MYEMCPKLFKMSYMEKQYANEIFQQKYYKIGVEFHEKFMKKLVGLDESDCNFSGGPNAGHTIDNSDKHQNSNDRPLGEILADIIAGPLKDISVDKIVEDVREQLGDDFIEPSTPEEVRAELKKANSDGRTQCTACGKQLSEPYPGIRFCNSCEV